MYFRIYGIHVLFRNQHADITFERFPLICEMVLSVSSFYLAFNRGWAMVVGKVLGFSPSPNYFVL